MDGDTFKNEIKTSFLITNTFNAMVGGLMPVALGVGIVLTQGLIWPDVHFTLGYGAPMAALAALGYYAAFKENKKMLHIYSSLMGLVAALEVAVVVASAIPSMHLAFNAGMIIFGNIHIGVMLAAVSCSVALAKRSPDNIQSGFRKSSPCFLKYLGIGSLVVLFFYICSYVY